MFKISPFTIICLARAIRTFGFGSIAVVLALFLIEKGFSTETVGAVFAATLVEDAVLTTIVSTMAVRIGLRRVLLISSAMIALSGLVLATATAPWVILAASVFGIVSPAGYEGGPFSPVEQTLICESEPADNLTRAYSFYNLTGFAGAALGALFAGWATGVHGHDLSIFGLSVYQKMFFLYAVGGLAVGCLYAFLKAPVKNSLEKEFAETLNRRGIFHKVNLHKSRANVFKLAGLQSLDAFGGGFVTQSLVVYWFLLRYHAGPDFMGPVLFWANIFAALSFTVAPLVVKRIGLLNTMVFTHLPCSLALCVAPFLPDANAGACLILIRSLFSSMDIPVRQAYSMLLVCPDERPAAAGIISTARALSGAIAPLFSGIVLSGANAVFGLPFICAGVAKSAYDVGLYACFSKTPLEDDMTESVNGKDPETKSKTPVL